MNLHQDHTTNPFAANERFFANDDVTDPPDDIDPKPKDFDLDGDGDESASTASESTNPPPQTQTF